MIAPLQATARFSRSQFAELRRRTIFECGKWDPQYEDACVLADFALTLDSDAWRELAALAEELAREALAAEVEILLRPELHALLGLPRKVVGALAECGRLGASHGAARVIRFDFHWTTEGWRISEANSDVPGGFIEASGFSRLAAQILDLDLAGDPTIALASAVERAVSPGATIGLVHATAYTDDRQVMIHLAAALQGRGLRCCLLDPTQLGWNESRTSAATSWYCGPIDLIVRFFPGEWLPNAPRKCSWRNFFRGSRTPISNPGSALLIQSKRFPLLWDALDAKTAAWRALLPETRCPSRAGWREDPAWIIKPALGRVGEEVGLRDVVGLKEWKGIAASARRSPSSWVAQRRFEAVPLEQAGASLYPCLGVFVVDDRVAGVYGRVAPRPLIDARARDVAVLVKP